MIIKKRIKENLMFNVNYSDVALAAWKRHIACHGLDHYAGIVSLQGMARLAKIMDSEEILDEIKTHIAPFWQGEIEQAIGIFGETVYRWGGNASAFMVLRNMLPEAYATTVTAAENLCTKQGRDSRGIFDFPGGNRNDGSEGFIWIDTVFGVCPFLLWTGLAAKRQDFIDESCFQMLKHHEILFNKSEKIYHQAINYDIPGALTPAYWSRGCGWGALALAEMVFDLPKEHKDYPEILKAFQDLMEGCKNYMDDDAMLHQAMEDHSTYVETSGTALVLYAMGRGIKNRSLDPDIFKEPFLRGLKNIMRYVALDGSVFNCCKGCLAPGKGTSEDYANKEWILNDHHAFGPIILLFGQAEQLKINNIIPALKDLT
jgi:unsaturated rhamnogalacturonyl hydrolase